MKVRSRIAIAAAAFFLATTWSAPARAEGACGNGIVNHNEECDPGGPLHCNGDPRLPTCRTGADCASGVNCYFARSCCKFNCQFVGQGATCFDGNDCTGPDRCNNVGQCTGNPQSGNACDDGNSCTSNDVCVQGVCVGTLPAECDDHNPCTDDFCHPQSGCGHTFNTAPCDDGQLCTGNDTCSGGICAGSWSNPPSCDDGNTCTDDRCDPVANGGAGACVHQNNTAPCNDGNGCTTGDRCAGGICAGTPLSCDDGNPCTDDSCNAALGSCVHHDNIRPCDDGQLCTRDDTCRNGRCTGTPYLPPVCDDSNACTDNACDPQANGGRGGCVITNNTAPCDDGQFCTRDDLCRDGRCTGTPYLPPACDDSNVCTDNACDPAANGGRGGCVITDNNAPCDDGLFCTGADRCSGGQCSSGPPRDCSDGNLCTIDACDEGAATCRHTGDPSKAGQSCDDLSLCTSGDVCDASGTCSGTPIVCDDGDDVCTADSCNPATGCVFTVVVESPRCMSCVDGVDNDGDGSIDAQDCKCNLLCETFEYAVVAQRDSTRRTAYFGKDTHARRSLDPALGSPSNPAPYPLGPSAAKACSQGKLELVERAAIDGAAAASTRAAFGDGDQMYLGFFAGFVPPGQLTTTGIPPFVGPPALCSTSMAPCTQDADCLPSERCRPLLTLTDPANGHVDLTGTHREYIDCEIAKASLNPDFDSLFALTPTQQLGNLRYESGDGPIDVSGPGRHVVRLDSLHLKTGAVLPVVGSGATEAVIFQIERTLNIGVQARIELQGGLPPDRVLWLVDRRGRVYIGNQDVVPPGDEVATLPGTLLAPGKNIVVGKKARVAGALLGREVQLNEKAVVSHRPYVAAQP